jgi:hypothetical protein
MLCLVGITAPAPETQADESLPASTFGAHTTAVVKTEGSPTSGSRIRLRIQDPVKPGSHYLWIQNMGPPVDLGNQTGPEVKVTVPDGTEALGFLVIVADERGIRTSDVVVPIAPRPSAAAGGESSARGPVPAPALEADAGDDQVGLIGRRITLNGSASRPRSGLSYRWIQLSGPEIRSPLETGSFFSFVPSTAGLYRFALVVAHQDQISPPDTVTVAVGLLPGPAASPGLGSTRPVTLEPRGDLDLIVGSAVASLDDAPGLARPMADAFETASFRMDLYQTYSDVYFELSRRLDGIMPRDPFRRARWNAAFFEPLSRNLIARMLPMGLDLRSQAGQTAPLSELQKQELRDQFDRAAKLLRSVQAPR